MYPSIPSQDTIDLAWGGLQHITSWANLSQADKN